MAKSAIEIFLTVSEWDYKVKLKEHRRALGIISEIDVVNDDKIILIMNEHPIRGHRKADHIVFNGNLNSTNLNKPIYSNFDFVQFSRNFMPNYLKQFKMRWDGKQRRNYWTILREALPLLPEWHPKIYFGNEKLDLSYTLGRYNTVFTIRQSKKDKEKCFVTYQLTDYDLVDKSRETGLLDKPKYPDLETTVTKHYGTTPDKISKALQDIVNDVFENYLYILQTELSDSYQLIKE